MSRKRVPLNQNECTADFRIGVPFEQNLHAPGRSLDEWMKLVTECRQSGLTDAAWCTEHGISPSSFYNAVTRLRKRACQIPDPVGKANTLDFT